jgi:hypothetical protein
LVTGANKAIGFENGRQVGRTGALVLFGASAAKLSLALPPRGAVSSGNS